MASPQDLALAKVEAKVDAKVGVGLDYFHKNFSTVHDTSKASLRELYDNGNGHGAKLIAVSCEKLDLPHNEEWKHHDMPLLNIFTDAPCQLKNLSEMYSLGHSTATEKNSGKQHEKGHGVKAFATSIAREYERPNGESYRIPAGMVFEIRSNSVRAICFGLSVNIPGLDDWFRCVEADFEITNRLEQGQVTPTPTWKPPSGHLPDAMMQLLEGSPWAHNEKNYGIGVKKMLEYVMKASQNKEGVLQVFFDFDEGILFYDANGYLCMRDKDNQTIYRVKDAIAEHHIPDEGGSASINAMVAREDGTLEKAEVDNILSVYTALNAAKAGSSASPSKIIGPQAITDGDSNIEIGTLKSIPVPFGEGLGTYDKLPVAKDLVGGPGGKITPRYGMGNAAVKNNHTGIYIITKGVLPSLRSFYAMDMAKPIMALIDWSAKKVNKREILKWRKQLEDLVGPLQDVINAEEFTALVTSFEGEGGTMLTLYRVLGLEYLHVIVSDCFKTNPGKERIMQEVDEEALQTLGFKGDALHAWTFDKLFYQTFFRQIVIASIQRLQDEKSEMDKEKEKKQDDDEKEDKTTTMTAAAAVPLLGKRTRSQISACARSQITPHDPSPPGPRKKGKKRVTLSKFKMEAKSLLTNLGPGADPKWMNNQQEAKAITCNYKKLLKFVTDMAKDA